MYFVPGIFGRTASDKTKNARKAVVATLKPRQTGSSPASAASTSGSAAVASTSGSIAVTSGSTASASTTSSTDSATSGSTSLADSTSPSPSPVDGSPNYLISVVHPPPFTATETTAYTAPGVNATVTSTSTPPSTTTSSTSGTISSTTSQTTTNAASAALASATAFGVPKNELTACQINGTDAHNGPFCSPIHLQNMWVGYTYAFTWNPDLFAENATNTAQLRYNDSSEDTCWTSNPIPNYQGRVDLEIDKTWLRGAPGNDTTSGQNMTLFLISEPEGQPNVTKQGPSLSLVVDPATLPRIPIKYLPKKYGIEIGLPIGLAAAIIIILSLFFTMRKNNRHLREIKHVGKDYMSRRSRRTKSRKGDIQLEDYEMGNGAGIGEGYTDQPLGGGGAENMFRDEIRRQREEDDAASIKRTVTSF